MISVTIFGHKIYAVAMGGALGMEMLSLNGYTCTYVKAIFYLESKNNNIISDEYNF